ncbi:hypothetical protein FORC065_4232 [Yersinia enterocolitica]|nr:hypothetical protein FORC065_4232 [Yersinia enterocolitica]
MHVIHDTQSAGIDLCRTIVPHEVAQGRSPDTQPNQHPPLQRRGGQFLWIAESKPGNDSDHQSTNIEP